MSVILIIMGGEGNLLGVWNYCEAIHWSLYLISLWRAPGRWKSIWLVCKCQPGIAFRHLPFISRAFLSPLTNFTTDWIYHLLHWGRVPLSVQCQWKKAEDAQTFWSDFLTKDSANATPGHNEENKTKAPKSVTPKPCKEAKQTTVPGMKPTEVGQGEILPSPASSSKPWADSVPRVWDLFWTVPGRTVQNLWDILKGFSVKCPKGHLGKEPKLGNVSRWLKFWVK